MSQRAFPKDYYEVLGANERTSARELERLYKRMAARRHPDRGGSEEEMKTLNEAYSVLRNEETRRKYDAQRIKPARNFVPVSAPSAPDVGLFGQGLNAFFCLIIGFFLLFLVRTQWMLFLWPLAVVSVLVILFGTLMARTAMRAMNAALPVSNRFRSYTKLHELIFWSVALLVYYGAYLLLTSM
jgi:curved DNA-binding protein CbpA